VRSDDGMAVREGLLQQQAEPAVDGVRQGDVVELATELCRVPSPLGEEGAAAEMVAKWLERLDFEIELQEVVAGRPNVIGIARGDSAYQSIVLNGHLDTPPPYGDWSRDPFDPWIEQGVIHGCGVQDMKAGLAALVVGAAAAARSPVEARGDIIVTAVMHHDTTGLGTKYFLDSCTWRLDAGICGEPTNLAAQLFHGGAWGWEIRLEGVPRHQSRLEEGANAITAMLEVLTRLEPSILRFVPDPRYPFLPRIVVGAISGGDDPSLTAGECVARGDVRFLPSMSPDQLKRDLAQLVSDVCSEMHGISGTVRTLAQQWPYEIASEEGIVRTLATAHRAVTGTDLHQSSGLPAGAFITDAADMARRGIPTALYGPGDWRTEPDEGVPIVDLVTAARVYAATCAEITATPRTELEDPGQ
jgi:acetylornithine deacetylase